jgi:transcriptional regulator with XRE-family HTH domain/tetratricopeptide (TPR) repeat protein
MQVHKKNTRLVEMRKLQGWRQQDLADRLGVTKLTIGRWERGEMQPQQFYIDRLCELFGKQSAEELGFTHVYETSTSLQAQPSPETVFIFDAMIPTSTRLIGREQNLLWIKQRLFSGGNVALTAINGIPGVGKTALAIALTNDAEVQAHFHNGILWAALGPKPNIFGILRRWAQLLNIPSETIPPTREAWASAIRTAIAARHILVVIDDAWTLEDALTCQVGGVNCTHFLTTRFPQIAAHMTYATRIQELTEDEGFQLLQLLAPDVVEPEPQQAQALVQAVGGLPLALTLIGNYLRTQAYSGSHRRIRAAFEQLRDKNTRLRLSEPHTRAESHPSLPVDTAISLQSILTVTVERLTKTAQLTLFALAVFPAKPESFSEEAAIAVVNSSLEDLDELMDAGFLESTGDRYRMHQTIVDYASLGLKQLPEVESAVYDQLFHYFCQYFETHHADTELLEQESNNMLLTLESALQRQEYRLFIRGVHAIAPFLLSRCLYMQAEQYCQRAYMLAQSLHGQEQQIIDLSLYLGRSMIKQCKFVEARVIYETGLALARESQDILHECDYYHDLAAISHRLSDYQQAKTYLQAGLVLAREANDIKRIGQLLKILGPTDALLGNSIQAERSLQEGVEIAQQIHDRETECISLGNLGGSQADVGRFAQARISLQKSIEIAQQIGLIDQLCASYLNLGVMIMNATLNGEPGNYEEAERYMQECLKIARQQNLFEWIGAALCDLSELEFQYQHLDRLQIYIQEAFQLAAQINQPNHYCLVNYHFGNLALARDDLARGKHYFQDMLNLVSHDEDEIRALAYFGLARTAAAQKNMPEARRSGEMSCQLLEKRGTACHKEVRTWFAQTFLRDSQHSSYSAC